jgi:hypothetical protein
MSVCRSPLGPFRDLPFSAGSPPPAAAKGPEHGRPRSQQEPKIVPVAAPGIVEEGILVPASYDMDDQDRPRGETIPEAPEYILPPHTIHLSLIYTQGHFILGRGIPCGCPGPGRRGHPQGMPLRKLPPCAENEMTVDLHLLTVGVPLPAPDRGECSQPRSRHSSSRGSRRPAAGRCVRSPSVGTVRTACTTSNGVLSLYFSDRIGGLHVHRIVLRAALFTPKGGTEGIGR